MGTMSIHTFIIDGTRGILPLPRPPMVALNGIRSKIGLLKIPCGPCHLGRAQARAPKLWTAGYFEEAGV